MSTKTENASIFASASLYHLEQARASAAGLLDPDIMRSFDFIKNGLLRAATAGQGTGTKAKHAPAQQAQPAQAQPAPAPAKESRAALKGLASISGGKLTLRCEGRKGVEKFHGQGRDARQRYAQVDGQVGLRVGVKQADGLDVPTFTVDLPTAGWACYADGQRIRWDVDVNGTPVQVYAHQRKVD
jgi:hypothetical protein